MFPQQTSKSKIDWLSPETMRRPSIIDTDPVDGPMSYIFNN